MDPDPDPGGPKTCGSGSGFRSGSATLLIDRRRFQIPLRRNLKARRQIIKINLGYGILGSFYVSFLLAERVGELEKRLREERGGTDDNDRLGRETVRLPC